MPDTDQSEHIAIQFEEPRACYMSCMCVFTKVVELDQSGLFASLQPPMSRAWRRKKKSSEEGEKGREEKEDGGGEGREGRGACGGGQASTRRSSCSALSSDSCDSTQTGRRKL